MRVVWDSVHVLLDAEVEAMEVFIPPLLDCKPLKLISIQVFASPSV